MASLVAVVGTLGAPQYDVVEALGHVAQFRAAVSRVLVDVVVTDSDGNFVDNLTLEDFLLLEEGIEQRVLQAELIDRMVWRQSSAPESRASDPAGARASNDGAASSGPDSVPVASRSALFFLIDGPSLFHRSKIRFAEAWKQLLASFVQADIPQAAYLVEDSGQVRELVALTDDIAALEAAADAVWRAPLMGSSVKDRLIELANDYPERMLRRSVEHRAEAYEEEDRLRSIRSLEGLIEFCQAIAARPGRKAVVWVTTGIKWDNNGPYQRLIAPGRSMPEPDGVVLALQERVVRAANGWNVSLYPVDPSQTTDVRGLEFSASAHGASAERLRAPGVRAALDALADPLVRAADETGGRTFIRWSDLDGALSDIVAENSRFYMLTYEPRALRGDDSYREISIAVRDRKLNARGRAGFVDLDPQRRQGMLLDSALSMPNLVGAFPVRVEIEPVLEADDLESEGARNWRCIRLTVTVPLPGPTSKPSSERVGTVQIGIVVIDSHGRTVWQRRTEGRADGVAPVINGQPAALCFPFEFALRPARYELRVAILDSATGALGVDRRVIEIN